MAIHQLILPKMGESVSEATIIKWLKQPGDRIEEDEPVLEIATDKVDSDVPSPVSGILTQHLFHADDVVQVGEILANIQTDEEDQSVDESPVRAESPIAEVINVKPKDAAPFYSPLVKSIADKEGISAEELQQIKGSGLENRLTKQDVMAYLEKRSQQPQKPRNEEAPVVKPTVAPASIPVSDGDEIIEMDRMRRLIADHMVHSVTVSPHVSSFVEADVTNLVAWRNKIKDSYEKREGEKITLTPIFIEAVSKALKDFPMVNVSVEGYNIIKRKHINIGMATALPSGNLIVPVIKNADQLSLVGLSKQVNDLAKRARANKLRPDDTQGGTFTLTNIGAFGNLMGTPIINQPQVAIIAIGTITKKPAVVETESGDMIGIRHKLYLSISYDHRVVDGSLGGQFLKRVSDYLENWDTTREV